MLGLLNRLFCLALGHPAFMLVANVERRGSLLSIVRCVDCGHTEEWPAERYWSTLEAR